MTVRDSAKQKIASRILIFSEIIVLALVGLLPSTLTHAATVTEPPQFVRSFGQPTLKYPSGTAVAPDGRVYVSDGAGQIKVFTASGEYITQWGSDGSGDGQFNGPAGIAIASDSNIYVVDQGNNRVQVFTASGEYVTQWGGYGYGDGQFTGPQDIAIAQNGDVFVTDYWSDRVQVFTADGVYVTSWSASRPKGIAIASNGSVYVAGDYGVYVYLADGTYVTEWTDSGNGDGQFQYPNDISIAPNGNIYVSDSDNHRIQIFSADGDYIAQWGTYGSGDGQFERPGSVAIAPNGNAYVIDGEGISSRIQVFTATGDYITQWGQGARVDGEVVQPTGLVSDSDGNLYVVDRGNDRIQKFDAAGNYLAKFGSYGNGDGQLDGPDGIAIAPNGNLYVVDQYNNRVQIFTPSGTYVGQFGEYGNALGQLDTPTGIAIVEDGRVYVSDSGNYRIQVFTSTGTPLGELGTNDTQQIGRPDGIAVTSWGKIYVADQTTRKIHVFYDNTSYGGGYAYDHSFGGPSDDDDGLVTPHGVALDKDGNVYVTDGDRMSNSNGRIVVFSPEGDFITSWGEHGSSDGQFNFDPRVDNISGIVITPSGNIYVADTENDRIQQFAYPKTTATLPSAPAKGAPVAGAIIITTPAGTNITCSSVSKVDSSVPDSNYTYPLGLVKYCFTTGESENLVTITFVTDLKPSDVVARKFNPVTKKYATIMNASITETTMDGKPALQLSYTVVDNGPLDFDPVVGSITDPVGIALPADSSANGTTDPDSALADTGMSLPIIVTLAGVLLALGAITAYGYYRIHRKI